MKCGCWFQYPFPPKVYHGPEEPGVLEMPENERAANRALADQLFTQVLQRRPQRVLDIGAKIPALSNALATYGCDAYAMDACEDVAHEPGVQWWHADFETLQPDGRKFGLITLVHTFEHFYDPLGAIRRLRQMVEPDGRVFLRIPDHAVHGYERDLTPHHYTIHPFFHTLTSILQLLAEARDAFVVEWTTPLEPGQRDIVLRPIPRAPRLAVAMIVKNEERDLARAMQSMQSVADRFIVVDTGSTDRTLEVATSCTQVPTEVYTYLDASEQDETGDWKLWDFSAARNRSLQLADESSADWVMWVDGDDEVRTPEAIRRAIYWEQFQVYSLWICTLQGHQWVHHRLWKTRQGITFKGRCHEYAQLNGRLVAHMDDARVVHHGEPSTTQENSNPRNLRILLREWAENPSARTAFYIANTYRDNSKFAEAVEWYQRRIDFGAAFRDEWLFARLYMAYAYRGLELHDNADVVSAESLRVAPDWAEFRMDLSRGAYNRRDYHNAIRHAQLVNVDAPIPITELWREHAQYRDQPLRMISWSYEMLGDIQQALSYARKAQQYIGGIDADWFARIARLMHASIAGKKVIALHRPGAIGDILMTLNLVPRVLEANPDAEVWYFCHESLAAPDALGDVIRAAGVARVLPTNDLPLWLPALHAKIDLVGYPLHEGYPERPMRKHLLEYFGDELGVDGSGARLVLPRPPRPSWAPSGAYATMQVRAGWSAYKEWNPENWAVLHSMLATRITIVPLPDPGERPLAEVIALVANARMHMGIDSFVNHLTNYLWRDHSGLHEVPGVILWGSTQASAAGYATNVNLSVGLPCQPCFRENPAVSQTPRAPCSNGSSVHGDWKQECMTRIAIANVRNAVTRLWDDVVNEDRLRFFALQAAE